MSQLTSYTDDAMKAASTAVASDPWDEHRAVIAALHEDMDKLRAVNRQLQQDLGEEREKSAAVRQELMARLRQEPFPS